MNVPTRAGTSTLFLRLQAPFAAFRWLQAGVFRATSPTIPPSAAWGLALNLAGIESRGSLDEVTTQIRSDAPTLEIAVGSVGTSTRSSLYQQLHGYPVGSSGKELQARAHGQKFWIVPVRREVLVGFHAVVGVRGPSDIVDRIGPGLAGTAPEPRYGLPFAGDNQLLFDRIDVLGASPDATWFVPLKPGETPRGALRLTTNIDRGDSSRTTMPLFAAAPSTGPCPDDAWVPIGPGARAQGETA